MKILDMHIDTCWEQVQEHGYQQLNMINTAGTDTFKSPTCEDDLQDNENRI